MSFSRFAADDSDVYTFPCVSGSYECCGCILEGTFRTESLPAFLEHLDQHEAAGHTVPTYTRGAIREWADEHPDGWAPCGVARVIVTRRTPKALNGAGGVFGYATTDNVTATVRCDRLRGHDGHHKAHPRAPGFIHDGTEVWW